MPVPTGQRPAQLSDEQIAAAAFGAGVRGRDLPVAVAVALAESGGIANNVGDLGIQTSTWGPSIGLWQVRSIKAESGRGTTRDATRLADPAFNARSMAAIRSTERGWGHWSVYTSQAYRVFLARGERAAGPFAGMVPVGEAIDDAAGRLVPGGDRDGLVPVGGVLRGIDGIAEGAQRFAGVVETVTARSTWVRVAQVAGGGVLLMVGAFALATDLGPGDLLAGPAGVAAAVVT